MSTQYSLGKRLLAMLLCAVLVLALMPTYVIADGSSILSTDIGEKTFTVGEVMEFTFTTQANEDVGTMVVGTAVFSDPSAISTLEYYEVSDGNWYTFNGDFGPSTGFPMGDATSRFRVTFNKSGNYTVDAQIKSVETGEVLCSCTTEVKVNRANMSTMSTDIGTKLFVTDIPTEFTISTEANGDAGVMVIGSAVFSDPEAIGKLEYYEVADGNWYELSGDFGPSTGFPMSNATSRFRVTFIKAGTFTVTASMKAVETGEILCSTGEITATVIKQQVTLRVNSAEKTYGEADPEFTYEVLTQLPEGVSLEVPGITRESGDDAGTYALTIEGAKVVGSENYEAIVEPGVLTIKPRTIQVQIENAAKTYGEADPAFTYQVEGELEEKANLVVEFEDYTNAEVGTHDLNAQAWVEIDGQRSGNYAVSVTSGTLTVGAAHQTGFAFEKAGNHTVVYGDNGNKFTNAASGGPHNGTVTYSVPDNNGVARVNKNGEVTILGVGTVTVTATRKGGNNYRDVSVSYELTVEKRPITVTLNNHSKLYGQDDPANFGYGVTGSAAAGETLKVSLSRASGETVGTYAISASVNVYADGQDKTDNYDITVIAGVLTIGYAQMPEEPYAIKGEMKKPASGWYTDDVTIKPAENYEIIFAHELGENLGEGWKNQLELKSDGIYTLGIYLRDKESGGITELIQLPELKIDATKPEKVEVQYPNLSLWEEFWGYVTGDDGIHVKLTVTDAVSGIDYLEYSIDGITWTKVTKDQLDQDGSYQFDIHEDYKGQVQLRAADVAGNISDNEVGENVIYDRTAPVMTIDYSNYTKAVDKNDADAETFDGDTVFIYAEPIQVFLTIQEENFNHEEVRIYYTKDGEEIEVETEEKAWFRDQSGAYNYGFRIEEDGEYNVMVEYTDTSGNEMSWNSTELGENSKTGTKAYVSNRLIVDQTDPTIKLDGVEENVYYRDDQTLKIQVTERNFRPDEMTMTVTAVDAKGVAQNITFDDLTELEWTEEGDMHFVSVPFVEDANYTVQIGYTDMASHAAEEVATAFTVDKQVPQDLEIVYETGVFSAIMENITFGYYKEQTVVTLIADDLTSGVDHFVITAVADGAAAATTVQIPNNLVVSKDGTIGSGNRGFLHANNINAGVKDGRNYISFVVPEQFRGSFQFDVVDCAGNSSQKNDVATVVSVVDNISPTRSVSYAGKYGAAYRVVSLADLTNKESFDEADQVALYFNTDAEVTFKVKEANFYPEDVKLQVNGQNQTIEWNTLNEEEWEGVLTLTQSGDYVITMAYSDRSTNEMKSYTSQRIVIDKEKPKITVTYHNNDVKREIDGRKYYDAVQTATITIEEENFRADDVVVTVRGTDYVGKSVVSGETYANQASDRDFWTDYDDGLQWRRTDDTYVLELTYAADANYTFDIAYTDLAGNAAADRPVDKFTVDTTMPTNLKVSYSENRFEEILENVTFGYYNAKMTVTISAEDATSGVYNFDYSYINALNVSSVNAQLLDQAISNADIDYDGYTATAKFTIPKMALENDTQFNGKVSFTAYDRAKKQNSHTDLGNRIIVDNISPTATISFSSPVQELDGISYYAGDISGTIVINEANFDASDVVITVTKDGVSSRIQASWDDKSADKHTGSFTLRGDGDYQVSVTYADKSSNTMVPYTSGKMTIDMTAPEVKVSGIQANSANKEDPYRFTIEFSDLHLDADSMKPVLTAVIPNEAGIYETVEIDLGDPTVIIAGQRYVYTVENLELDSLYTLTYRVSDLSGNTTADASFDDGFTYDRVQFSINRNGSAFGYGSEYTEDLVNQYYVYEVTEDVVLVEVNVDPIEDYVIMLNGEELVEGQDYVTAQTSNPGEWNKYSYIINKDLFAQEGEYSIIVNTKDKAENVSYSDIKKLAIRFVVDQTAPILTITGLETGSRYQTSEQTVTLIPTDEGGRLNSLKVIVMDSKGNPLTDESGNDISSRFDMEGAQFQTYLEEHNGIVTFTVPEGINLQVQIICNDCAEKENGGTNEYTHLFTRVTVSQNYLVILLTNPVSYGVAGGLLVLLLLILFLLKRKKSDKK